MPERRVAPYRCCVRDSVRSLSGRALPWVVGLLLVGTALDAADGAAMWLAVAAGIGQAVLLHWRHQRPEAVTLAVLVLAAAFQALAPAAIVPFGAIAAVWGLASERPPQRSLVALAGLLAITAIGFVEVPDPVAPEDVWFVMVVDVCVWALAEARRSRRAAIEDRAQRAVRDEQARIARELHDVIAHSVTVMVVQAGAASDVFERRPDQARAAIASIEEVGRATLAELRRLLGGVRARGPDGVQNDDGVAGIDRAAAPQPGLGRIEELARPLRAAGVDVEIVEEGAARAEPAGVDVSAYRIVQEALTNVLRHAGATRVQVAVRHRPDAVEIEVVDDGRGGSPRAIDGHGPGLGLVGMRERTALLGGRLDAGPTAHGGFRIHAVLPLEPPP
jgi:signal transduction histidine kinase